MHTHTSPQPATPARFLGNRGRAIQAGWLLLTLVYAALMIVGTPLAWEQYQTVCTEQCLSSFDLTAERLALLHAIGMPVATYATVAMLVNWITVLLSWTLGAILIWRKPHDRVALLLAVGWAVLDTGSSTLALWRANPRFAAPATLLLFLNYALLVPLYSLFPDGRWVPRWSRWVALVMIAVNVAFFLFIFPAPNTDPWVRAKNIIALPALLFVAGAQVYRYRRVSTVVQRQQTKWVVFGFALLMAGALLLAALPLLLAGSFLAGVLLALAPVWTTPLLLFFNIASAIAILRYRLFDIDLIINRTLVYGVLTASIVAAYVFIVGGLGAVFAQSAVAQDNLLFALVATGVVAVLFQPLRDRVQRGVNRLMYGERDDPYAVLSRLGKRLEATLVPDAVMPAIVDQVARTLKLPYVALKLADDTSAPSTVRDNATVVAAYGQQPDPPSRLHQVPLTYGGTTIGALHLAPRAPDEPFTPAELRLLDDLARQAGVAVRAVQQRTYALGLAADLQQSRERLVAAREEERRRLRRDLHDGLGPALASLTLKIDLIHDELDEPATAASLLMELKRDVQAAIADIRRLVYALRPPALDDLGLAGALELHIAQYQGPNMAITFDAPELLPSLPAAVEVAIYRIAVEGLTNVLRHAQARACCIRLTVTDMVELEIVDDGRGLPEPLVAGVGLASMRERAAELGGQCVVEPVSGGGTRVRVTLPLA